MSNRESVSIERTEIREMHITVSLRELVGYNSSTFNGDIDTYVVHIEFCSSSRIRNKTLTFRAEALDEMV